jgi:hypothetical protein
MESPHETKKDGATSLKRISRTVTSETSGFLNIGWLGVVVPCVGLARGASPSVPGLGSPPTQSSLIVIRPEPGIKRQGRIFVRIILFTPFPVLFVIIGSRFDTVSIIGTSVPVGLGEVISNPNLFCPFTGFARLDDNKLPFGVDVG